MADLTDSHAEHVQGKVAAFNRGDAPGYAAHYADDATLIDPFFPEPMVGREAIEQTTVSVLQAFPGMQWKVVSLLEDGDRVATELHVEGIQNGPLVMPDGELPPTGRPVSFDLTEIIEFNEHGLIAQNRTYMDPGVIAAQLGLTDH